MSGVSLTDQLGAMSVIDGLRHRAMVVQEQLNLRARREDAAAKIRAYYQSKGIEVDDGTVLRGVREYFDRRLTYEAPSPTALSERMARLFITRAQWQKPAGIGIGALLATAVVVSGSVSWYQAHQVATLQTEINLADSARGRVSADVAKLAGQLAALSRDAQAAGVLSGVRMSDTAQVALTRVPAMLPAGAGTAVTQDSMDADQRRLTEDKAQIQSATRVVSDAAATADQIRALLATHGRLRDLEKSTSFKTASEQFPKVATALQQAKDAIAHADTNGVPAATKAVDAAVTLLTSVGQLSGLIVAVAGYTKEFAAMPLAPAEQDTVKALTGVATAAIAQIDLPAANRALEELRQLLAYAKTPITLDITNRSAVKSGVERNFNASGGKTWYLVVDATDAAGKLVSVPVKNAENGQQTYATTFGVSVPEAEYRRVKAEKQKDGHIRNRAMGAKPAGSLTIKYAPRVTATPDTITTW